MDDMEARVILREHGVDTCFDPRSYQEIVKDMVGRGILVLGDNVTIEAIPESVTE